MFSFRGQSTVSAVSGAMSVLLLFSKYVFGGNGIGGAAFRVYGFCFAEEPTFMIAAGLMSLFGFFAATGVIVFGSGTIGGGGTGLSSLIATAFSLLKASSFSHLARSDTLPLSIIASL